MNVASPSRHTNPLTQPGSARRQGAKMPLPLQGSDHTGQAAHGWAALGMELHR